MEMIDFKKANNPELERLPSEIARVSAPIKDYDYLLYYKGVGMFPRGDIQGLFGKAKTGKTTVTRTFITAILTGECFGFNTKDTKQLKVLIIDTEQSPANVIRNYKRILKAANFDTRYENPALLVLQLRGKELKKRWQIINEYLPRFNPDFVLIDGIRDLCEDYNDNKESGKVIDKLSELSLNYKCAILNILHLNKTAGKNATEEDARGHLGTDLIGRMSEGYLLNRNGHQTEVTPVKCRNEEIPPFAFEVVTDGEAESITITDSSPEARREEETEKIRGEMRQIFEDTKELRSTDIKSKYYDLFGIKGRAAQAKINSARDARIIEKEAGKMGKYYLSENHDFGSIELPSDEDEDII